MDLESYHGSSMQHHQQQQSFKGRMTSSQQYHESVTSSKKVTKSTTTSSNYGASSKTSHHVEAEDILDEEFLKEQEFIENYIESSFKESRERSLRHSKKTYTEDSFEERKTNNKVSVKAIKGTKQTKQDDVIDGFQKVTVSSGSNEVNHFSRSISHDPENDVTSSSDDSTDDVSREMVDEDIIIPQTDPMNDLSGERSFEEIYGHQEQKQSKKHVFQEQTVNIKLRKEDEKSYNQQQFSKNQPIKMNIDVLHDQHHRRHQVDVQTHQETKTTNQNYKFTESQPVRVQIGVSHDHEDGHAHQNKSFEEVTYRLPVDQHSDYDQQDGTSNRRVKVMVRSPRDDHPDFDHQVTTTKDHHLSVNESQIPMDIQVKQSSTKSGAIRVVISPSPNSQEESSGFRPIQKKESPELQSHQHIVTVKPTAIRKSSDSSTSSESQQSQQIQYHQRSRNAFENIQIQNMSSEQYHEHQRKRSDDSEQIQIIRSIRKSSLPEGFDSDSEFRRETDLQLQRQRDLQQRMSQRQHNETRITQRNQQNNEYYKQQQYHQQKLMQHQQHLQRIQQQQQQQQKRKQQSEGRHCEGEQHSHVVLNGRVMRRHSFDNSALAERKQDEEKQKYIGEHQQRQAKTQRSERPQTRVRRLSYEQEREKLEEELKRLQEKEVRKQQHEEMRNNKSKQHQQNEIHHQQIEHRQQQNRNNRQNHENNLQFQRNHQSQIQQTTTTTKTNIIDHQTRQAQIFNNHPQQFYSQSASNTPVIQRRKFPDNQQYPASANTTPNVQRKRGKIPNILKVGFQSEDIINVDTRRRKSNPNVILGRTDINKPMDITHHSHTLPRNFGTKNKSQQLKTHTLTTTTTTTRSTRPSRSNKDVKRSNSLGSSNSISTSVLDESRMNKAQQKYIDQQQHYVGQQSTSMQQQNNHDQQSDLRNKGQQNVENRVGISVNKQRHVQQQRGFTTHQILAETMKAQNKQQEIVSAENNGLNIINGSHFKKDQKARKTSSAFTQLTKPQPKRPAPAKPKRVEPVPKQEDVYQSIKVSAKGGVITLFSEKDHQKVEVSDSMKQNITTSMYGHQSKHTFHESNDQHSGCVIQGSDQETTAYRDNLKWDAASGYQHDQDTEVIYYTVCTHFFHPENNDWIQKIHRMGQARVPKNHPHNETCVFLNHLYDPDKEEIVVHKVINQNQNFSKRLVGLDQSDHAEHYHNKHGYKEPMLISHNQQPQKSNQIMSGAYGQDESHASGVYRQHQQHLSGTNHESGANYEHQHHLPIHTSGLTRSRTSSHNRSWVDQAFSDAYDTMSERMDTTGYSTTFDELDTAFDARSIDSSISSKSGYQNHVHSQQQRHHFQQTGHSIQQQNQHQQQQQQQQRNIHKDYAKFVKQQMNTSSEGR